MPVFGELRIEGDAVRVADDVDELVHPGVRELREARGLEEPSIERASTGSIAFTCASGSRSAASVISRCTSDGHVWRGKRARQIRREEVERIALPRHHEPRARGRRRQHARLVVVVVLVAGLSRDPR